MAIVRFDPFAELDALQSQMSSLFDQAFGQTGGNTGPLQLTPVTNIYTEDDKQAVVEVHLPGFTQEEVDVDVHEGVLEIRANHTEKEEDKKKRKYMLRESSQSFYRRIALPKQANEDGIKAHFGDDGVLKVTVPFKELPKSKKIAIGSGKKS